MTAIADPVVSKQDAPRAWKTPGALLGFAVIALLAFALGTTGDQVTFRLSDEGDAIELAPLSVSAKGLTIVLALLMLVLALVAGFLAYRRIRVPLWLTVIFGAMWVTSLVTWVGEGTVVPVVFLLTGAIAFSTPVIYGALAGVMGERVGVANIAIEGQLLMGAFVAAVVGTVTGNLMIGLGAAMIGGAAVSLVLAAFSIVYLVDQIIVGVVLNVLVIGITNFFFAAVLSENSQTLNFPGTFPRLPIPLLSDIPVLGPVLFEHRITTYLMFVLVPLVWFLLFKTRIGLRIRAVGEHPLAADTVGINVRRTRFWTVTIAGLMAGIGGAVLTIGASNAFVREMSAGQGYIALATVILGRWNPLYAALAALLFGFSRNFRVWAGQAGAEIPGDLIAMTPYLVTLIAVAGLVGRAIAPAAVGKPYIKE